MKSNEIMKTRHFQVRAEDSDTGANGNVTYSLVKSIDQDSDRFTIDPVTGVIVTAEVFDREARTGRIIKPKIFPVVL